MKEILWNILRKTDNVSKLPISSFKFQARERIQIFMHPSRDA
jgi:hypothetical protein